MARKNKNTPIKALLIVLIFLMIAATGLVVYLCINLVNQDIPAAPPQSNVVTLPGTVLPEEPVPQETTRPKPQVVSSATIGSMGDLLMHIQLLTTSRSEGGYDFYPIFQYMAPYISQLDYAAANLETTFGGSKFPYQGNPALNTPDSFADTLKDVGFDMLLTANNHCGDTLSEGVVRTVEQLQQRDLDVLGTRKDKDGPKYLVKEVNGIKLGMICYTYATGVTSDGRPQLNLNAYLSKSGLVNFFMESNLNKFYTELQTHLDAMKAEGAEATIVYLHWGKEYQLEQNATQKAMAQKLCDMGVDVIIGGHPHVIQPMDLLESTVDPSHKTVCIYSMGNAVSNQRIPHMRLKSGHTEDAALFTLTFDKYDDGSVHLSNLDVLPAWVQTLGNDTAPSGYRLLPLDDSRREEWADLFELDSTEKLASSYDRTMDMVGPGLQKCNDYLAQAKAERESAPAA